MKRLTRPIDPEDELRRLFAGAVENVFCTEIGLCIPSLTDYLGGVLADFVHIDRVYRLQTIDGRVIREISRMEAEASLGPDVDETARIRIVNKHIGDFTLFWTGLYPESLQPRRGRGVERLSEYVLQGKRGYGVASRLTRSGDYPPGELLRELSEHFECCVHGLNLVRESWEQLARRPRQN